MMSASHLERSCQWCEQIRNPIEYGALKLESAEKLRQTRLQSLGDFLDIHQGYIANSTLDATVVSPVKPAAFRGLFLIDALRFADATNRTAKPDPDIDGYHPK